MLLKKAFDALFATKTILLISFVLRGFEYLQERCPQNSTTFTHVFITSRSIYPMGWKILNIFLHLADFYLASELRLILTSTMCMQNECKRLDCILIRHDTYSRRRYCSSTATMLVEIYSETGRRYSASSHGWSFYTSCHILPPSSTTRYRINVSAKISGVVRSRIARIRE